MVTKANYILKTTTLAGVVAEEPFTGTRIETRNRCFEIDNKDGKRIVGQTTSIHFVRYVFNEHVAAS